MTRSTVSPSELKMNLLDNLEMMKLNCATYDQGHSIVATQLAVNMRVLLHDTRMSTSLVTLMNAQSISLTSSQEGAVYEFTFTSPVTGEVIMFKDYCSWYEYSSENRMCILVRDSVGTPAGFEWSVSPIPKLERTKIHSLSIHEWLTETILMTHSFEFSREALILKAANKAGGAHIAPDLSLEEYALIHRTQYFAPETLVISGLSVTMAPHPTMPKPYLMALRQMAWEILNSPDLLALTV